MNACVHLLVCGLVISLSWQGVAADVSVRPVVLNKDIPLRSNTRIREKREIQVENGISRQVNAKESTEVGTRYVQRINWVRRIVGAGMEEVQAHEIMGEFLHFTPITSRPPPDERPSSLMSKSLRARKSGTRWNYDLAQGRPTQEERQTLGTLATTASLLDMLSLCIGNDAHKPGETWKTNIPSPRGKATGIIVLKDISCVLVSLDQAAEGAQATILITGRTSIERPMGYNAHVDIAFEATLIRRLADMLDIDTKIKGTYALKGEADIIGAGKTQLDFVYPFTLTRTLKFEDK